MRCSFCEATLGVECARMPTVCGSSQPQELTMSNPYDTAGERMASLPPTLRFKGELSADEDLLIQGQIEGTIKHTQRVTVGKEGKVKANISAQVIKVEGTVEGD